jgi:hypothetical protein
LSRNERGRFGALKSDSTHHFFRNACTKSGSLGFSQFSGVLYEIGIDGIKGRKNLEILEMKPNLKSLNDIHREKSGKRTGNTSTV